MLKWPWEKSIKDLYEKLDKESNRLADMQECTRSEMSSLGNLLAELVSEIQGSSSERDEAILKRIETIESNIRTIHTGLKDTHEASGQAVKILKDRLDTVEDIYAESEFFISTAQQESMYTRIKSRLSRFFARWHILIVTNIFLTVTVAALAYLIYLNT